MSASEKSQVPLLLVVAIVAGLIVGCLFGWLAIGWWLWPVEYQGEAYSYELNDAEKIQYVAAVADSYDLNRQVDLAQQRLAGWTTEEKVAGFAELFVMDQAQGKTHEAQMVVQLTKEMSLAEGWDPAVVQQTMDQLIAEQEVQQETQQVQLLMLFASDIGMAAVVPSGGEVAEAESTGGASGGLLRVLLYLLLFLLLLFILAAVVFFLLKRRPPVSTQSATEPVTDETKWTEWAGGEGPEPLLARNSVYRLGMDNFDESFSIEEADGAFLGECGMGISETMGEESPRRVTAFEVWLFDKSDIRTVTKVLMSAYAYNNEGLRNKLSSRGEPVLATPGTTLSLETASLTVEARVAEMDYGDGAPESSYFNNMSVSLVARPNLEASPPSDMILPDEVDVEVVDVDESVDEGTEDLGLPPLEFPPED